MNNRSTGKPGGSGKIFTVAATTLITALNGAIAFYGWNSAENIRKIEEEAKNKLESIQKVTERGYILYARGVERQFFDLIINGPGIEATGTKADYIKTTIQDDKKGLDILEKEIKNIQASPIKHLLEGYLSFKSGNCKDAISHFSKYEQEKPEQLFFLAAAESRCGNPNRGLEKLNKALSMPMSDRLKARILDGLGNVYMLKNDPINALPYYEEAVRRDSSLYSVNYNFAAAYTKTGKYEDAISRLCLYSRYHDEKVVNEVESDPDGDFAKLHSYFGENWKEKLQKRLSDCMRVASNVP